MAGIIHDKGIATYVPELAEKLGCYSACSFMFFGGKIRQADGILAVHQAGAYGSERDKASAKVSETQQNTQFTVSEIIGFLNVFETPPWVFEKMFRSREFYVFSDEEKTRLAARSEEISSENLYEINAFVTKFLKYLDDLAKEGKKTEVQKQPKISKEEQLRLAVIEIQKLLNAAGCNAGVADGVWGRRTQAAAIAFAKKAKLPTTRDSFLSEKFLTTLANAPKGFCPKQKSTPTLKRQGTIGGSWNLKAMCNNGQTISGRADLKLALKPKTVGKEAYTVAYRNSLNQKASGQGRLNNGVFKVTLYFEGVIEPLTASFRVDGNRKLVGIDSNNCSVTASRM